MLCLTYSSSACGDGTLGSDGSFRYYTFSRVCCPIIGFLRNNLIFFYFLREDSPEVVGTSIDKSFLFLPVCLELEASPIFLFFRSFSSSALCASGWSSYDAFL